MAALNHKSTGIFVTPNLSLLLFLLCRYAAAEAADSVPVNSSKVYPIRTDKAVVNKLQKLTEYVRSLPIEEMLAMVPAQSGIYFTDCPNCEFGIQDRGNFEWLPKFPTEVTCKDCRAKYPNHPNYPDNKVLEVKAPDGVHRYPYYERPKGKYRIFFRAHADYFARDFMAKQCQHLAELFWATKDESHALRAALILRRFAEVYPGYAYHMDDAFQQKKFTPYTTNRVKGASVYRTAKWDWWAYMDISRDLLLAYDCLRGWPGLQKIGKGDAIRQIEDDLFGPMVEFVLGFREIYSNMSPGMWRDVIHAGRILRRPAWVHEAVRRVEKFVTERFFYDGQWMETSPSYCSQVIGNLQLVVNALKDYEDPPGYKDSKDGTHFEENRLQAILDARAEAGKILVDPRFPDGSDLPVNDTWYFVKRTKRTKMKPVLMPGFGLAVLGGGKSSKQLHAYLNFTGGRQHKHMDALSIGLFAHGKELLRDIGYCHNKYRCWTRVTAAHNTVVVNGKDSAADTHHTGHRLRAFVTDGSGFHLAEAESVSAYPQITDRYRRTLITIGGDASSAYLLDIFQISGGDQHDYLLHGCADEDSTAVARGVEMKPFSGTLMNPGVEFVPPVGETSTVGSEGAFGFVHDISAGRMGEKVVLDMRLIKSPDIGTRTHLFAQSNTTAYLGEAPSIRRSLKVDSTLDKYQAPFFTARRKGKDLKSVFVAVHEPVNGKTKLTDVSLHRWEKSVVVTIRHHGVTDIVAVALDEQASSNLKLPEGSFRFHGRYGMLRKKGKKIVEAHLAGGTKLGLGNFELAGLDKWSGKINDVVRENDKGSRGWFEVEGNLPKSFKGTMLITFPDESVRGYNVDRIEPAKEASRIFVKEDPGFVVGTKLTRSICYPLRDIEGTENNYELLNAIHFKED